MEFLQLRYFFESAKNGSFAKTAQKYMVPTTSVSSSVKRLENELGCKLFDRLSNKIILNQNGIKLQQSLLIVFEELDRTVDSLSAFANDTSEIKMLVRAMRYQITDYIVEYKTKHPNITFKTVFDFDETNFEDYDIIIDDKPELYEGYESFEICSKQIKLKCSASNPICNQKLTLKQLCNQPFISMGEKSSMHQMLIKACARVGFTPDIVVKTNDISCYNKCLKAGVGIGLGRDDGSSTDSVKFLDVTDFNITQTVCAYYKKHSAYGNIAHFLKFIEKGM